jgi:hypothetical protein
MLRSPGGKTTTQRASSGSGLKPAFVRLRAFFQERSTGVPIEALRIDEKQDLALVKTVGWVPTAPPLELQSNSAQVEEGQPVILIGYPTGLEAVMARLDTLEQDTLEEHLGACSYGTAEQLSGRKNCGLQSRAVFSGMSCRISWFMTPVLSAAAAAGHFWTGAAG